MTDAELLEMIKDLPPDKYAELKDRRINLDKNYGPELGRRIRLMIEQNENPFGNFERINPPKFLIQVALTTKNIGSFLEKQFTIDGIGDIAKLPDGEYKLIIKKHNTPLVEPIEKE